MKALVTGANGFTGSYLTRHLIEKGYDVRGLVREESNRSALGDLPVEFVFGNLADQKPLDHVMSGVEIVYHVAAAFRVENVPSNYFMDVNVGGTRKLLAAAKRAGVCRFVHVSTIGVQGGIKNPPAKETDPYNAGDKYQRSKVEGEKLALRFFGEEDLPVAVVRPAGIYGPGDLRFLKLFRFINNGTFRMIGNGKVLYHPVYVEDLVRGIILAGEKDQALGEVFTIAGETYLSLTQFVETIARVLGKPVPARWSLPYYPMWLAGLFCEVACKPFGIPPPLYRRRIDFFSKNRAFDISKAKRVLGYEPQVSLEEGLKRTADWYRAQGLLD